MVTVAPLNPRQKQARARAYDAPYLVSYKAKMGSIVFPSLVPSELEENKEAWDKLAHQATLDTLFFTMFSDKDPVTKGIAPFYEELGPEGKKRSITIKDAGHFLQEDKGPEIARKILDVLINQKTTFY